MPIYALDGVSPELPPEGEYWIAPDAVLIGKVRLKKHASVWWGAVLLGDNEWITVGENSNIQDGSVLHTDPGLPLTIGDHVTVGHRAILHSAVVGDYALIGMGAVLLSGVAVGRQCLVGANALLTEGRRFEDGKLIVGSPARAMRDVTQDEKEKLARAAAVYVANARRYAEKLTALP